MSNTLSGITQYVYPNTLDNLTLADQFDGQYVAIDGSSTMTGDLDMGLHNIKNLDTPTTNDEATNKLYVDTADNLRVLKSGDTMTGNLINTNGVNTFSTLSNNSLALSTGTSPLLLTTYTQQQITASTTSGTGNVFYNIDFSGPGINALRLFRGTTTSFPRINIHRGDNSLSIPIQLNPQGISYINGLSGDTCRLVIGNTALLNGSDLLSIYGNVSCNSVPTLSAHLTRKDYVDLRVLKSGDTMSGTLDMGNNYITNVLNPINAQDVATKNYIDNGFVNLSGVQIITGTKYFISSVGSIPNIIISRNNNISNVAQLQHQSSNDISYYTGTQSGTENYSIKVSQKFQPDKTLLELNYNTTTQASYIDAKTQQIKNVVDPTNAQDVATKNYVDTTFTTITNAYYLYSILTPTYTYNNETNLSLDTAGVGFTLNFNALNTYTDGKNFTLMYRNTGIFLVTMTITLTGSNNYFSDGVSTTKTFMMASGTQKMFKGVINGFITGTNDYLFLSEMTLL
jgi:hypothetical protein